MSTFDAKDLPPIVHYLQVIILASMIETAHQKRYGQSIQPDQARIQAMQRNVHPDGAEQEQQIKDSFHTAIRIWKAHRGLGIRWNDNIRIDGQELVMLGLT